MLEKLKVGIKKYKWFIIILIIIIFLVGCYDYTQRNDCKDKCVYLVGIDLRGGVFWYWQYKTIEGNSKNFETQSQCVDYCLKHK